MSFIEHRCVIVVCDECGEPYELPEEIGTWHFSTRAEAAQTVEDGEWSIVGDHALCRNCVDATSCALLGHRWASWRDHVSHVHVGRVRMCHQCGEPEWDPPVHGQIALDDTPPEEP